tara:strand:- start:18756 stop:18998 length:243 start_codon:yes stop_codon:yes gene_type:complete
MYAVLALPFSKGMRSAPTSSKTWGGILVIVVLVTHYQGPQDVFGNQYEKNTGNKSIYRVEAGPIFPFEVCVLVEKLGEKE